MVIYSPVSISSALTTISIKQSMFHRFDLLAGFNGMEGNLFTAIMLGGYLAQKNMSLADGCSKSDLMILLHGLCGTMVSPESPELCEYFINKEYEINGATDDVDRVMKFTCFTSTVYS